MARSVTGETHVNHSMLTAIHCRSAAVHAACEIGNPSEKKCNNGEERMNGTLVQIKLRKSRAHQIEPVVAFPPQHCKKGIKDGTFSHRVFKIFLDNRCLDESVCQKTQQILVLFPFTQLGMTAQFIDQQLPEYLGARSHQLPVDDVSRQPE